MNARSLILVTVDCLRADHVGFLGYSRPTTPFLDSLAKESIVFSNAIVAGAPTYFSFPAILASRYPLALGRDVFGIAPGESTLATELQAAGYATGAFIAGNPYLTARFGYDQGFDEFQDFLSTVAGEEAPAPSKDISSRLNRRLHALASQTPLTAAAYEEFYFRYCQRRVARENVPLDTLRRYPPAHVVVDQASSWLANVGDRPFFLWIHLMDPHHPYYPPEAALAALSPQTTPQRARFLNSFWNRENVSIRRLRRYRDEVVSLYDAGIYWADLQISRLVSTLKQLDRWKDSVFALTADHGEEFLEHGTRYHNPGNMNEGLIRVPLLVRFPASSGNVHKTPFSHIDLAPTLLLALNVSPSAKFRGRPYSSNLDASNVDLPVTAESTECTNPIEPRKRLSSRVICIRGPRYKLTLRLDTGEGTWFDLDTPEGIRPENVPKTIRRRFLERALQHVVESRRLDAADSRLRAKLREIRIQLLRAPSQGTLHTAPPPAPNPVKTPQ
jgi:arylsulfatase A-like enzyme